MSAEHNLDADAFMRKYLECPSDATARLVFADWLEETGIEHNASWAHYIRLKAEADRYPFNSATRNELERHAGLCAVHIRAKLAIPAKLFVGYPKSLLQLLPEPNITVDLSRFEIPLSVLELVPESVARENLVIPIATQERVLLCAAVNPCDYDTWQKLQFILNRDIIFVGAERDDVHEAIERSYGLSDTESVDSVLYEFTDPPMFVDTAIDFTGAPYTDAPVVRLVNLLLADAVNLHADRVTLTPVPDALVVRHRVADEWVERDFIPRRLLRAVTTRLAIMAGIDINALFNEAVDSFSLSGVIPLQIQSARFRVRVQMTRIGPSSDGPSTQLDIVAEPPEPPSPAPCP